MEAGLTPKDALGAANRSAAALLAADSIRPDRTGEGGRYPDTHRGPAGEYQEDSIDREGGPPRPGLPGRLHSGRLVGDVSAATPAGLAAGLDLVLLFELVEQRFAGPTPDHRKLRAPLYLDLADALVFTLFAALSFAQPRHWWLAPVVRSTWLVDRGLWTLPRPSERNGLEQRRGDPIGVRSNEDCRGGRDDWLGGFERRHFRSLQDTGSSLLARGRRILPRILVPSERDSW